MLKSKSKYYYSKLDNGSKAVYDSILSAWEVYNQNPSFQMDGKINMQKIFEYIKFDNPGLFFVDFKSISVSGSGSSGKVQSSFLYNKNQIINMEKKIEAIIASILLSDNFKTADSYGKEIILHDYLVKHIVYTLNTSNDETTSVAGALLAGKAVCEGFAKAFKLLCDNAGLSCIFVSGKAVSPYGIGQERHAWNIIKIDNACAHIDVTWDNTSGGGDNCYDHFNLTDDDVKKDHTWEKALFPMCNSPQLNYYLKNKICAANREEFIKFIKEQAKQGKKMISVKLTGREITNDQLMKAVNEALFGIIKPGQQLGFQYNKYRHIVKVKIL
ncbi:MAG: hypothetical protein FWB86_05860 [Treponema sp.]|nr:hypothetical protein [Treponema sp.]MCL2251468.1 hypothetical protein [Treponema sp.]